MTNLHVGDWVEIKSKDEILNTLDKRGQLDAMPFMPEMYKFCGRRFQVFRSAHKTCDTVNQTGGRRIANSVHLDLRCDGSAHGGCQAGCLLFWKEAWLKRVDGPVGGVATTSTSREAVSSTGCTEADVLAGTRAPGQQEHPDPNYVCQATQIPAATTLLAWWDFRQYFQDVFRGNIGWVRLFQGAFYASYYNLSKSGIGTGRPMRWFYDWFQNLWGGVPYPRHAGRIPKGEKTPPGVLKLQPGELVRVKPYQEILATLDTDNKNRGLYFDAEAVPFCGNTYRVRSRVSKILDEKTGKLVKMKTESVILEGVFCQARYSDCRMFCPRAIYSYWREIWLERVDQGQGTTLQVGISASTSKESDSAVATAQ